MPFPYVFTFYSYKGGVGRSLALMNVAYTLAGRGRHVLMVDMDLEAPGISGFMDRTQELAEPEAAHPKDILTLLGEAVDALRTDGSGDSLAESMPPLSNYIRAVKPERLTSLQPRMGKLGRLDVLGTDLSRDYLGRLSQMELADLPQEWLVALSKLLHRYFKAQVFPFRPLGVEDFEPPISTPYDYVLVDSRTGITEIGGLCVGPLADRLVVVTGLNDQNVQGTRSFLEEAGISLAARSEGDKPWDEADTAAGRPASLGPKPTILVASPVPIGEITYRRQRLQELEALLGLRPVSLSYHPQMALMESVLVRDCPEEYLAREYSRLADLMMVQVGDDPQRLSAGVSAALHEKKDVASGITSALRVASHTPELGATLLMMAGNVSKGSGADEMPEQRQLNAVLSQAADVETRVVALGNWGSALLRQARGKSGEDADRLFDAAYSKYAEAFGLKPDHHATLANWGTALSDQAKTKWGEDADRLFDAAYSKYAEAFRLKPDDHAPLFNWGLALYAQAKAKSGEDGDRLFGAACSRYAEAFRLKPDHHDTLYNWGAALSEQAKAKSGEDADRLFDAACSKYAKAVRLKPDDYRTYHNWGTALLGQAKLKFDEEADRLFESACAKYAEAVHLKPDEYMPHYNWGNALYIQATKKSGEAADRLWELAYAKYAEAVRLAPDDHKLFNTWGNALYLQATRKSGETADRLLVSAFAKYAEALCLRPDDPETLKNWGNALYFQAAKESGDAADRLFDAAYSKYAEAYRLKPDDHETLSNWGAALSEQARARSGEEADRLLDAACSKYAEAYRLKPDSVILNNWGVALSAQADLEIGPTAARVLGLARQKLLEAEGLQPGSGAYNLSCVEAKSGNVNETIGWLQAHQSGGKALSRGKLASDKDFDRIRNHPEFLSFLQSLPEE